MKKLFKSFLVGGLSIAAASALFVGVGSTKEAVEVEAATTYVLTGVDYDWKDGSGITVDDDGNIVPVTFKSGSSFKFKKPGSWDSALGYSQLNGTAKDSGILKGSDNIWFAELAEGNGTYWYNSPFDVSIKNNSLTINPVFYYVGSGDSDHKGADWTPWTATPLKIDTPTLINFKSGETFKVKLFNTWEKAIGYSGLSCDYKGDTVKESATDGNIQIVLGGNYYVKVYYDSGFKVALDYADEYENSVYVLDKYGDLLNNAHNAHFFGGTGSTGWPGQEMLNVDVDAANVWKATYPTGKTTVIFNQIGDGTKSGQTIDLTINKDKCLLLNHDVNGEYKWNSNTWVSLETALFIDKCMHFADYNETQKGEGKCLSEGWYTTAKKAYEDLDPTYKEELSGLDYVVARLDAWAVAYNNTHFTVTAGIGAFGAPTVNPVNSIETNNVFAIIAIASITLVTLGGVFILRRKEN